MDIREWLAGGLPELERQRDEAFANYHQTLGAIRALDATLRWLDEQGAAGEPASDRPTNITELRNEVQEMQEGDEAGT